MASLTNQPVGCGAEVRDLACHGAGPHWLDPTFPRACNYDIATPFSRVRTNPSWSSLRSKVSQTPALGLGEADGPVALCGVGADPHVNGVPCDDDSILDDVALDDMLTTEAGPLVSSAGAA